MLLLSACLVYRTELFSHQSHMKVSMGLLASHPPGQVGDKKFLRNEEFETVTANQWVAESAHVLSSPSFLNKLNSKIS